jgi:hypothetical protein
MITERQKEIIKGVFEINNSHFLKIQEICSESLIDTFERMGGHPSTEVFVLNTAVEMWVKNARNVIYEAKTDTEIQKQLKELLQS